MAAGVLPRGLAVLQCLVGNTGGLPLTRIADEVGLAKSATHRILMTLIEEGFVRQLAVSGNYGLTLRIVSMGLRHVANTTITELALPVLTRLAVQSGQLVRLGLLDDGQLLWVARSQGARAGLRYEPDVDHGSNIPFGASASGLAWLSLLPDEEALRLVARQEPQPRHPLGVNAPRNLSDVLDRIHDARRHGWARVHDSYEEGISAMAAPLLDSAKSRALGVVSIAGPSVQLTDTRMEELAPALVATANELSELAGVMATELRNNRFTEGALQGT